MKIVRIVEQPVRLEGQVANAFVSFADHTVSLVAIVTDVIRDGRPVVGLAFNSIGRYAQSGILRERMIPRLLSADPDSLLQDDGRLFSPQAVLQCSLRNEKPGGHGDRASAAAALEMAVWDLNGKLADLPVSQLIARHFDLPAPAERVAVYAAGGYYYPDGDSLALLKDEFARYRDDGFTVFKMKIAGAPITQDLARIDAALSVIGDPSRLAVDANGKLERTLALDYAKALAPYGLRWFEEIGDPLHYALNAELAQAYPHAIATGENLFSRQDVRNLMNHAGLRPGLDVVQMDCGLSYGITEYAAMLDILAEHGMPRSHAFPHGGQLMQLQVVGGFGLGGCEAYPQVFKPMGGFADDTRVIDGSVALPQRPGFGFEAKADLIQAFNRLLA